MQFILVRHGNTFNSGDTPVWVGRNEDLPLVSKGLEQAEIVANALQKSLIQPSAVFCSELSRTQQTAEIIIEALRLPIIPIIDERLTEIDYGDWGGLSTAEITKKHGNDITTAWNELSLWPRNANWQPDEQTLINNVKTFVADISTQFVKDDTVVIISSNGVLRYFLNLVAGEFEKRVSEQQFKMKTGFISKIAVENGSVSIDYWNQDPSTKTEL